MEAAAHNAQLEEMRHEVEEVSNEAQMKLMVTRCAAWHPSCRWLQVHELSWILVAGLARCFCTLNSTTPNTLPLNHALKPHADCTIVLRLLARFALQVRAEAAELEELRELKKDIERKEKQQAAIIENQVGTAQC